MAMATKLYEARISISLSTLWDLRDGFMRDGRKDLAAFCDALAGDNDTVADVLSGYDYYRGAFDYADTDHQ